MAALSRTDERRGHPVSGVDDRDRLAGEVDERLLAGDRLAVERETASHVLMVRPAQVGASAVSFRAAAAADADSVAALHADSWRRYCRGACGVSRIW
jgi:hypothetical protein